MHQSLIILAYGQDGKGACTAGICMLDQFIADKIAKHDANLNLKKHKSPSIYNFVCRRTLKQYVERINSA